MSLALTLLLEIGYYLVTCRLNKKDLLLVALVNVLTNPIVVLCYWLTWLYTDWNTFIVLIPLELFAVIVEGCYYRKYGHSFKKPFRFSIAANAFSFTIGFLVQLVI